MGHMAINLSHSGNSKLQKINTISGIFFRRMPKVIRDLDRSIEMRPGQFFEAVSVGIPFRMPEKLNKEPVSPFF